MPESGITQLDKSHNYRHALQGQVSTSYADGCLMIFKWIALTGGSDSHDR